MTKSALKSLGRRLKHNDPPADEDLEKLEEVLLSYDLTLARVTDVLRDLGYQPTSRLKTTGTLIEKLRREESMPLPSVQDIAGARIVLSNGRKVQDRAAFRIQEKFRSIGECSDWIDRRERPSSGYRACISL